MKTMKYEWTMKNGMKGLLEASYSEHVEETIVNLDGETVRLGESEIIEDACLVCYVDGKKIHSCIDTAFWTIIDAPIGNGIKMIHGIQGVGFSAEVAAEIEAFLRNVIEAGKTAEGNQVREEKAELAEQEEVAEAREIIRKAEAQKDIPSRDEAERREWKYNEINNAGGYGFVPHIISREEYEKALGTVARAAIKNK